MDEQRRDDDRAGAVVVTALLVHIGLEFKRQARPERPGVTGVPSPN